MIDLDKVNPLVYRAMEEDESLIKPGRPEVEDQEQDHSESESGAR